MFITELFIKYNDSTVPYHPERNRDNLDEDDAWHNEEGQWYNGRSMFHSSDQDPYTGPQSAADEWYNGDDQWHGKANEDFAVTNIVAHEDTEPVSIEHILNARSLIRRAIDNKLANKHEYFEFLKYLRDKYGKDYSTAVHQKAVKLST